MVETRAELPFIGDQIVCLSHDHAARSGLALHQGLTAKRLPLVHQAEAIMEQDPPLLPVAWSYGLDTVWLDKG